VANPQEVIAPVVVDTAMVVVTVGAVKAVRAAGVAPQKAMGSLEAYPRQVPSVLRLVI
jgi:hypothetical protein